MADGNTQEVELSENAVAANNEQDNGNVQPAEQAAAQPQRPGGWSIFKTLLVRMFFIYMISSFFRRGSTPPAGEKGAASTGPSMSAMNLYHKDMLLDLYVFVSEQEYFKDFKNKDALFWMEDELRYGDWTSGFNNDGSYEKFGVLDISENVQHNASLYIHVFFVKSGKSPNPDDDHFDAKTRVYRSKRLNKYKKRKFHTTVNLLTGTTDAHPDLIKKDDNQTTVEILSHWHPNLTLNLVEDFTPWQRGSIPAPLDEFIEFTDNGMAYYPILYMNDYWNLNQHYMPINETTPKLNLSLTFAPMSLFKWQMYAAQGMRNKWYSVFGDDFMEESDDDQDSLKTTLVETNPYLLALTIIVSLVHSVFEFLAFKNDIQFWKNKKSLEGLSVRSVFFNVFQSLIVVLYVLDNETNFIVKVSVFIGLAIEVWKITKVIDIRLNREEMILGFIPRIKFSEKATYVESDTKKYDKLAFKYLSWVLFPLLAGYAVYSIIYHEHKGWYSWVLNILYGFLLMFGFIMMTPQLFINYKLKSVAHLPWRMMTYKALNTFIDDLFAFVIKMPILYRLGCFRDDIVFIIFLYQKWIYPVDKTRVNEFGVSGETIEEAEKEADKDNKGASANGQAITSAGDHSESPSEEKSKKEKKED